MSKYIKPKQMKNLKSITGALLLVIFISCDDNPSTPKSSSGVKKASVKVETGSNGLTAEQTNIANRLKEDNKIGAIKHLYVISAMSGQTILYSTVDGKVTSGGKRLTPKSVAAVGGQYVSNNQEGMNVNIGGNNYKTPEVIQDDGTYGNSMNYLYWWDIKGVYHQHYVTGGQIVHISSEALPVSEITINLSN